MPRNLTQYVCLNGVAAALLLCGNAVPGQAAEKQLVLLYNTAQVAREIMAEAQATAAQVLRQAGIEVRWMDCSAALDGRPKIPSCSENLDKRPLVLQVLNLAGSLTNQRSLGYAAVDSDGGTLTFVYFDRVEKFMASSESPCSLPRMLGHAMAHEMGHLLLSLVGHNSEGIMVRKWGQKQLQQAANGELLFTFYEAARMREEVKRRAAAGAAKMTQNQAKGDSPPFR